MSERFDPDAGFAELLPSLQAGGLRAVRPFAPARRMAFFVGLFAVLSAGLLWRLFGLRADHGVLGAPSLWGLSVLEMAAALALAAWVLREAVPGRSPSAAALGLGAAAGAAVHVAVGLTTFARSPVFPAAGREWEAGRYCFAFEVALAVPCVLFALWLGRRGLTARPRRLGLVGGLGAGLAADAIWRLICPYSDPAHAFSAHTSGVLGAVVVGLLLALWWERARLRAWRAARAEEMVPTGGVEPPTS